MREPSVLEGLSSGTFNLTRLSTPLIWEGCEPDIKDEEIMYIFRYQESTPQAVASSISVKLNQKICRVVPGTMPRFGEWLYQSIGHRLRVLALTMAPLLYPK